MQSEYFLQINYSYFLNYVLNIYKIPFLFQLFLAILYISPLAFLVFKYQQL